MSPQTVAPVKKSGGGVPTWVYAIGAGLVVVLAVVGLSLVFQPPAPNSSGDSASAPSRTIGNPQAKVALVEYSDFQ